MIWSGIGRILVVGIGFVLAAFVGTVTLFLLGARWAAAEMAEYTPDHADEMSQLINEWFGVIAFFMTVSPVLTLLPALAIAIIGEVTRIRSALFYIFGGGIASAIMPFIMAPAEASQNGGYSAEYFAVIATAGFAGGLVYWLVAGRNA